MQTANQLFSDDQRRAVSRSVAEAEAKTSAEIVPVVATSSGRYDRAEDIVGVYLGIVLMLVSWWLIGSKDGGTAQSGWGSWPLVMHALALAGSVIAGFFLGAALASKIGWLRRLFVPRRQMIDEVDLRANGVFFDSRTHHTAGATGILIYLSLFERRAVVRADRAVEEKLEQGAVDEICESLLQSLRGGEHPADALQKAIADAGDRLAKVLPRETDDVNELSDALVILN